MTKKSRVEKNPVLKGLVEELSSLSPAWKAVAKGLDRSRRVRYEVNLLDLERNADPKFTTVVPGIVLGTGEVKKKLTVAALKFSKTARQALEKSGGKCLSIKELSEKNKEGKGVQILG